MDLVLVSKHSVEELQKMAEDNFGDIQDKSLPVHDFRNEVIYDRENSFGRIFKVIPASHIKYISLIWKMPESISKWRSKSPQYLSHVFGHEGSNSLFSELVKGGYATWLSAGSTQKLN